MGVLRFAECFRLVFGQLSDLNEMKLTKINEEFIDVEVDCLVAVHFPEEILTYFFLHTEQESILPYTVCLGYLDKPMVVWLMP